MTLVPSAVSYTVSNIAPRGRTKKARVIVDTAIQQPMTPETAAEPAIERQRPPLVLSDRTPQDFYAEVTKRPDVRVILGELATG